MSERYIKVFTGSANLYLEGAPIIIRANVLLKDTDTGKMIAQLKLKNMSGKSISYVNTMITPLNAINEPLGDAVAFEYLDLAVSDKEEFGSKKAIYLPNLSTRAFCVSICKVGFSDGTVWQTDVTDWKAAEPDSAIVKALAVEETYKQALSLAGSENEEDIKKAKEIFESIQKDWDVTTEISMCDEKIEEIEKSHANKKKRKKKALKISAILAGICIALSLAGYFAAYPLIATKQGDYSVYIKMYHVKDFKVPNGVTSIGKGAFGGCSSLTSIVIPDSVTSIGDYAFSNCRSLTSIVIPDSVTSIGYGAFYDCSSLTSITIGNGVTSIGYAAFFGCDSLTSVTISNGLISIGDGWFSGFDNLTSIVIPDSVTSIGGWAFDGCSSLTSIEIPDSVTSIGRVAFYGCSSLTSIVIPNSVTSIGERVFCDCSSLTSIVIPDSVTSIGYEAFYGCSSLTNIVIPDSVTSIGGGAFEGCSSLTSIQFSGTIAEWSEIEQGSHWHYGCPATEVKCSDGTVPFN